VGEDLCERIKARSEEVQTGSFAILTADGARATQDGRAGEGVREKNQALRKEDVSAAIRRKKDGKSVKERSKEEKEETDGTLV